MIVCVKRVIVGVVCEEGSGRMVWWWFMKGCLPSTPKLINVMLKRGEKQFTTTTTTRTTIIKKGTQMKV